MTVDEIIARGQELPELKQLRGSLPEILAINVLSKETFYDTKRHERFFRFNFEVKLVYRTMLNRIFLLDNKFYLLSKDMSTTPKEPVQRKIMVTSDKADNEQHALGIAQSILRMKLNVLDTSEIAMIQSDSGYGVHKFDSIDELQDYLKRVR